MGLNLWIKKITKFLFQNVIPNHFIQWHINTCMKIGVNKIDEDNKTVITWDYCHWFKIFLKHLTESIYYYNPILWIISIQKKLHYIFENNYNTVEVLIE